jgi:Xaa-Pro aminopeptidase
VIRTMEPVMKHGRSTWDRAVLPADEFEERRLAVDRAAGAMGVDAVVGFEDSSHPGLIGYLSNYLTAGAIATLIYVPGGEATLLAGLGGGRDHPFIKGMSVVQDVRWFPQLGAGIAEVLEGHGLSEGRIAVAGAGECFNKARADGVFAALERYEVVTFDDALDTLRRNKRERELSVMRAARAILGEARSALLASLQATGEVHDALVVAERVTKLRGCRDFRALVLARNGSLRPWPDGGAGATSWCSDPVTVYLAAEYLGYWADLGFSRPAHGASESLCAQALDVAQASLRVGSSGASLRRALSERLGATADRVTLEATGMGLSLVETPNLSDDESAVAREGDLVCLRVWARDGRVLTVETRQVVVEDQGSTPLEDFRLG